MSVNRRIDREEAFRSIPAAESPGGPAPCGAGKTLGKTLAAMDKVVARMQGVGRAFRVEQKQLFSLMAQFPQSNCSAFSGPRTHPPAFHQFEGDDGCNQCGSLILSDAHRQFVFYRSPADIQGAEIMGGVPSEWRPCPDEIPIPGDDGPNRVAYWRLNEATVQVHDGDDAGFWSPCFAYTVTRDGLPYSMWVCRRSHVNEPCDDDFMRSISS